MGEIIYNGISSKSIDVEVETFPAYHAPKRTFEKIHIPGRNGDLIVDGGCWENVTRSYLIAIGSYEVPYYVFMNRVAEWLHSATTYVRLEDSYEPDYYRLAVYLEEVSLTNLFNHGGEATIDFDCKPQRFLKIGDEPVMITKTPYQILNPTKFASQPIIHVYGTGNGTLVVGNNTITISDIGNEIVIDSEIQDAYLGLENKNQKISIPSGFPTLDPGLTPIGYSGGVTKVEVIPKWFTL